MSEAIFIEKEKLEQLYIDEKKTLKEIAKILNVSISLISVKLKKYNIKTRKVTNSHQIKHYVNHDYFENINETSARILGLILTDGSISADKSYYIRFTNKQEELCKLIKDNLGGSYCIDKRNVYNNRINSRKIYDFLNSIGITERKTKTVNIDFSIFSSESLLYAFLIGVIDGDGYAGYAPSKKTEGLITNCKISIVTGSKLFKDQILKYYPDFMTSSQCRCNLDLNSYNYIIDCSRFENLIIIINKIIKVYEKCGMLSYKYNNLLRIKQHIERDSNVVL